jgi:hypothetical protein
MANLLIPRREIWTQQPQVPVEIDWSNPISAGLLRSYDFGNLGRDATRNGAAWWSTGSTQPAITTAGRGLKVAASGQLSSNESVSGQISTGITLFLIAEKNAKILSASDFIFGATTELDAGDFNWGFYESVSTGNLSGFVKNASNVSVNVTGGTNWLPDKGPQFWALTYGGGDNFVRLYLNGFEVGSAAQTGLIKQTALNARIAGWNVSSPTPGFTVIRADIWNRNIGSDGVARLSKYPWQIFAPRETRLFVPVSAGGSTLNASASGNAQASGAASPAAQIALSAVGVSTASGTANATGSSNIPLSATGLAVSSGTANPTATITISAAGLAQAAGQAGLAADVLLAGAGAAQASGNATLAAQLNALASGSTQAAGTANLTGGAPGALSASGQAQATGSAALKITVALQASGSATAAGLAGLANNPPGALSANGLAQASASAPLSASISLSAAGFVQAMATGQLLVTLPLAAFAPLRMRASHSPMTCFALSAARHCTLSHEVFHG